MQDRYGRALTFLAQMVSAQPVRTDIPARLDRLPWSRWHWLVITAFGLLWAFNGLEVAVIGASAPTLTQTLNISIQQVGIATAFYLLGAILSAPIFGYLSDVLGRRKPFLVALAIFAFGALFTSLAWGFWSFAFFRFITGIGVGGEYVTINSTIAELVPARVRGRAVIAVNGAFWLGALLGAAATIVLLNPNLLPPNLGWRITMALGIPFLLGIPLARRWLPESPRQMMVQARFAQANALTGIIEAQVMDYSGLRSLPRPDSPIQIRPRGPAPLPAITNTLFRLYPRRSILSFSLIAAQAFLFNAVIFTYTLLLSVFYQISNDIAGLHLAGLVVGCLLGPWALGSLFDDRGRKPLITITYLIAALLIAVAGYLFAQSILNAVTHTIAWVAVLFLASSGASGAYLTAAEIFPQELRATALGVFFASGSLLGIVGSVLFASFIQTASSEQLFGVYLAMAVLMASAALVELFLGIESERRTLESLARPLSVEGIRTISPRPKKTRRRAA
ncbi:MAG: MFS transporter [Chloroflexota bacterium]